MEASTEKKKGFKVPHTLILIYIIVLICGALTYIIPVGIFDVHEITVEQSGGKTTTRTVLKPETFRVITDEAGNPVKNKAKLFATEDFGGGVGVLNAVFEGLVSGNKWSTAVGIVAFVLIIGGAFGVVMRTGAVDTGLNSLIAISNGKELLFIPLISFMFSLGGAIFGMNEEIVPFVMVIAPMMVLMGYDSIVAIMVTYVSAHIGFCTSWMNPFGVALAQGIAELPIMSGWLFRLIMWFGFTSLTMLYTLRYAKKIKADPKKSYSYNSDNYWRENAPNVAVSNKMGVGEILVLLTVLFTVIWVIYGVVALGYYIPEIASQFFIMGAAAGLIGVVFKMKNMELDDIAHSFIEGTTTLMGAALVIGIAKGVLLVLGGSDPQVPSVLNTILHNAGSSISFFPPAISAWFMFIFQSVFNFFIVSGSGQAAITMPLMAPLSDMVGVTRQVGVLAYQLGDGFTNVIIPTSGVLIACLSAAKIDYTTWFRFQYKFQIVLFVLGSLVVVGAVFGGFN